MMKKILKIILCLMIVGFLVGAGGATALIMKAHKELPDLSQLIEGYTPVVPSKIYDTNGEVIDILYKQIRETATIEEMPKYLRNAYVAIEDRHFYQHHGFYLYGMGRAVVKNFVTMSKAQGASSITQQLAKNAFLSNEKKIMRKVKEALITIELERSYTKDEILEKYLNEIYFGSGAYGVKTAASAFYGKAIGDLSIAESALLAGIPNRPSKYNPRAHLDNAIYRFKIVLGQMRSNKFITEEEYQKAIKHKFYVEDKLPEEYKNLTQEELNEKDITMIKKASERRSYRTPDFTNIVEKKLFDQFTEKEIYEEGLQIYTTLDIGMQRAAKDTFNNYSRIHGEGKEMLDGGMVTIEADTGYVRAVVGGKNFKAGDYNRAIYAKRQPGSSFKPFVYFTALRLGYPMNTVIEDTSIKFGKWEPRNFELNFRKNFTLLEGMERSVNIVAIKALQKVGLKNLDETVKLAGGEDIKIPQNLTAALGTMVVSPYQLSSLYLPFANGGYRVKPEFITLIKNRYGKVVYRSQIEQKKVFDSDDVALITHMMKDVVKNGTGVNARVKKDGKNIAQGGKTGTTNRQRTAWYAGITPKYVTTVYLGYDDNRPMDRRSTGGGITAKLWGNYYQELVDQGYDTGESFRQISDGLKNGTLTNAWIDSKNGRLADSTSGWSKREALFKRGTEPVEMAAVYNTRFDSLFNKTNEIILDKLGEEGQSGGSKNEDDLDSDSMFKDLFSN